MNPSLLAMACVLMGQAQGAPADQWKLVWSDEFGYVGLPDKTKWDYEEGFIRNKELQYYTRARSENAILKKQKIRAQSEIEKLSLSFHHLVETK